MNSTVFLTILSGVITFALGQIFVKLVIDPVQDLKKTIGQVSHSLLERANVIANPGVPSVDVMRETSQDLRRLSSQLQAHLYLVPLYGVTGRVFFLPSKRDIRAASSALIGLSNSIFQPSERIYEQSARRVETICYSLGIFLAEGDRLQK